MSRSEEGDKVLGEETAMVGLAALAAPGLVKVALEALEALEALGPVMLRIDNNTVISSQFKNIA